MCFSVSPKMNNSLLRDENSWEGGVGNATTWIVPGSPPKCCRESSRSCHINKPPVQNWDVCWQVSSIGKLSSRDLLFQQGSLQPYALESTQPCRPAQESSRGSTPLYLLTQLVRQRGGLGYCTHPVLSMSLIWSQVLFHWLYWVGNSTLRQIPTQEPFVRRCFSFTSPLLWLRVESVQPGPRENKIAD